MIDDELNAASVRLFNDSPNGDVGNAYAAEVGGNKTLETSLNAAIDHTKADWEAFAEVVAEGLQQRRTIAMNRFFDPDGMPPVTRPKTNMGVRR